jgi:hypothetical protein
MPACLSGFLEMSCPCVCLCALCVKTNSRPSTGREFDSRGSTRFAPVHPPEPQVGGFFAMRSGAFRHAVEGPNLRASLAASNGAIRSTYSPSAFSLTLAGGFRRRLPEEALNRWPLLPVGTRVAYSSRSQRFIYQCGRNYMPVHRRVKRPRIGAAEVSMPGSLKMQKAPCGAVAWWAGQGSNLRPLLCQSSALTS